MSTPALLIRSLAVLIVLLSAQATQAQCTGTSTTQVAGTRTVNSITVTASNTTLLYVGMPLQGSGIPTGTVVAGILNAFTFTMSAAATQSSTAPINLTTPVPNADWQTATVPDGPPTYTSNAPPTDPGTEPTGWHCGVCPSQFTVDICGNEYARMYLCAGNVYTIALCGTATEWNSTISITGVPPTFLTTDGFTTFDDDGCGTSDGHASLTYTPQTSGLRSIRILSEQSGNPCIPNHLLCGTLTITCSGIPDPPPYDDPCGAISLPVNAYCATSLGMTSSWSTATQGVPPASCGSYAGNDVWASAVVPASGVLVVQVDQVGAVDLAMAIYSAPACTTAYLLGGTRTTGFTLVTGSNTTGMVVGMIVTGTGIPAGTTVASIVNASTFTMSNAATANASSAMQVNIWTEIACTTDLDPDNLDPFIAVNDPALAGQTVWIRLFPESGPVNGGSFELCAFEPTPNFIDNPCTAAVLPVSPDCTPLSASTALSTANSVVPDPSCSNAAQINDVWFTVQIPMDPEGMGVEIQLASTSLDDAVMAVYSATDCTMDFTEVACSDPEGSAMPIISVYQNGTTIVGGTVLYMRVWNNSTVSGPFQICARPAMLPVNDEPCGALMLDPIFGCLPRSYPMFDATVTGNTAPGVIGIPAAPCGLAPERDIWFTVVVPSNGELILDMEATELNDVALALYTAQGSCAEGTLELQPISGGCATEGSTYDGNMPALLATGLTPGDTLYLRVWQESGPRGDALICARRTDEPSLNCRFELRLNDLQGNGWSGNTMRICIDPPGPSPIQCNDHTIEGSSGWIAFWGNVGTVVTINAVSAGASWSGTSAQLLTQNGQAMYISYNPITPGLQAAFIINASCNIPPAPSSDCFGSVEICAGQGGPYFYSLDGGPGLYTDLNETNRGCLSQGDSTSGRWITFIACGAGDLTITLEPSFPESDLNWAIWEYQGAFFCPPSGPPLRCSNAVPTDGNWITGMRAEASDSSEDASGDGWLAPIQYDNQTRYLIYIQDPTEAGPVVEFNVDPPLTYTCQFGCIPTEISSLVQEEHTLQPNPARDRVELMNSALGHLHWEIRDSKGMLCGQGMEIGPLSIPVAHLAPGLYMLRTVDADGSVRAYRWVKE